MAQKIYTRKGDKGYTSIMGTRERYRKSDPRIEAIGTIDELNSYVGMIRSYKYYGPDNGDNNTKNNVGDHDNILKLIQNDLFSIGSSLAFFDNSFQITYQLPVESMEQIMDIMSEKLSPLKNFILPGGNQLTSFCHIARTVCRRAERCLVSINSADNSSDREIDENILKYINRLSDYFFVLSRTLSKENNIDEIIWSSK